MYYFIRFMLTSIFFRMRIIIWIVIFSFIYINCYAYLINENSFNLTECFNEVRASSNFSESKTIEEVKKRFNHVLDEMIICLQMLKEVVKVNYTIRYTNCYLF